MSVRFGASANNALWVPFNRGINGFDPITVTVWGYARSDGGGAFGRYISKEVNTARHDIRLYRSNGPATGQQRVSSGFSRNGYWTNDTSVVDSPAVAYNRWHQVGNIAMTEAPNMREMLYVNGVLGFNGVGTVAHDSNHTLSDLLYIGNRSDFNRWFDGMLAHVAIWRRALSPTEMMVQYKYGPLAVPRGLAAYWPLDANHPKGPWANVANTAYAGSVVPVSFEGFGPDPYAGAYVGGRKARMSRTLVASTLAPRLRGRDALRVQTLTDNAALRVGMG